MAMTQRQEIFDLVGGRVRMWRGVYNPTADAVWLGAALPAGVKTVLDVGIGTGGVALTAMYHNPDVIMTGIDIDDVRMGTCARNAELNGRDIELINADILSWHTDRTWDAVVTNPPYFDGTPASHNAHHNTDIRAWVRKCVARVRPRGYFLIIVDAAKLATVISAMTPTCGGIEILPLFGAGRGAERVIIRGRVGVKTGAILHPAFPMNYPPILRDGLTVAESLSKLGGK